MPFVVAYGASGNNRRGFEAYIRLLEKRGIDWTSARRTLHPGTTSQWLSVWSNRSEAEAFCKDLKAETQDENWYVAEVPAGQEGGPGPLARVVILMRPHSLGADFSLHPHSKTLIRRRFPKSRPVSSISIQWSTQADFEMQHGPIWDHVAVVLTGLTLDELAALGGYEVYDLIKERKVYDSNAAVTV